MPAVSVVDCVSQSVGDEGSRVGEWPGSVTEYQAPDFWWFATDGNDAYVVR